MKLRLACKVKSPDGTIAWRVEEPELIKYAVTVAELWLKRERKRKGYITADHLNKACGILAEEIYHCMLCQSDKAHVRTVPLLNKEHPVNASKPYDFKIEDCTYDVKCIPPFSHHRNLNVNMAEIQQYACDIYILAKCYPELPAEYSPPREYIKVGKEWALAILSKVNSIDYLGYASGKEVINNGTLVQHVSRPFYSLDYSQLHKIQELW